MGSYGSLLAALGASDTRELSNWAASGPLVLISCVTGELNKFRGLGHDKNREFFPLDAG